MTSPWTHNLDEKGTLRIYFGPYIVSTLQGVSEAQVEDLVEEVINAYEMDYRG